MKVRFVRRIMGAACAEDAVVNTAVGLLAESTRAWLYSQVFCRRAVAEGLTA